MMIVIVTAWAVSWAGAGPAINLPVKVFLCAGQSNMGGAGSRNALNATDAKLFPDADIRFWFADPARDSTATNWVPLGTGPGNFGPEQLFAIEMKNLFPSHRIAIVKVSRGATAINYWLPAEQPGGPGPPGHQSLARTLDTVTRALDAEKASGALPGWSWGGFVWMQGEGDANGTMGPQGVYLNKLKWLAAWVRERTGTAALPIVIGRISSQLSPAIVRQTGMLRVSRSQAPDGKGMADNADHLDDGRPRGPIWFEQKLRNVRADQQAFCAADPCAAWVDIDDLVLRDAWHYDAAGYAEMGRRFAAAYRSLTGTPRARMPAR